MNVKDIKNKLLKAGNQTLTLAIVAAVSSGVTYYECKQSYDEELAVMADEVETLRKKAENATVTQRISEQMEDIAYQQKAVSDKQRERAEEQSRIADIERGKAEYERGMAQQAEVKALKAADEADRMRLMAEHQTQIATENMLVAEEARAQADTLFYLALSRSLSQAALRESAGGNISPLAKLLSYASWHYSESYGGKGYKQDMYRSLVRTSGLLTNSGGVLKGNVRYVGVINGSDGTETLAITDYGELMLNKNGSLSLFRPSTSNYRSVVRKGNTFYTLTNDGKVNAIAPGKNDDGGNVLDMNDICTLPEGIWSHILLNEATNQLIAISDKQIAWIDIAAKNSVQLLNVEGRPSCLGMQDGTTHVFTATGAHYISTKAGELMPINIAGITGEVTVFCYNDKKQQMYLGMKNGMINIVDANYNVEHSLSGHTSAITCLGYSGPYIISGSYDKTLKYWEDIPDQGMVIQFDQTFSFWPLAFDIDHATSTMWVGTESGYLVNFCMDMAANAQATRSKLEREFTDKEWDYYVGKAIPKHNFMKGKEDGQ